MQDEELDDLAGQVQLLEQAKLRLEMNLEQLRKEHKKELTQRDEENEETRCNMTKKVKGTPLIFVYWKFLIKETNEWVVPSLLGRLYNERWKGLQENW